MKVNWYNAFLALICFVFLAIDAFKDDVIGMILWGIGVILNLFFILLNHQIEIYSEITKKNKEKEENNE